MNDQTIKRDAGKFPLSLVPMQIVRDIAEVRQYGVAKYGATDSWRRVEIQRYIDAMLRHTLAFVDDPEGTDPESGIEHYKHVACNWAFLCELLTESKSRRLFLGLDEEQFRELVEIMGTRNWPKSTSLGG